MSGAQPGTTARAVAQSEAGAGRPSPEQRAASGKAARAKAPLEAHVEFRPARSRDPVALLLGQAKTRVPSWCRSGTVGCWCRRSPSTGARPW
jgi:hypothetical protein